MGVSSSIAGRMPGGCRRPHPDPLPQAGEGANPCPERAPPRCESCLGCGAGAPRRRSVALPRPRPRARRARPTSAWNWSSRCRGAPCGRRCLPCHPEGGGADRRIPPRCAAPEIGHASMGSFGPQDDTAAPEQAPLDPGMSAAVPPPGGGRSGGGVVVDRRENAMRLPAPSPRPSPAGGRGSKPRAGEGADRKRERERIPARSKPRLDANRVLDVGPARRAGGRLPSRDHDRAHGVRAPHLRGAGRPGVGAPLAGVAQVAPGLSIAIVSRRAAVVTQARERSRTVTHLTHGLRLLISILH